MKSGEPRWDFFTNHAHVMFYLQAHPDQPLRQVALAVGITERAVQRIVAELEEGGYLRRSKVGRQNQYLIVGDVPLPHALQAHRSLQDLLDWEQSADGTAEALEDFKALENWKVGEHGSEI
ncbi:winged helix-turn-helix domain-containing protein [Coraliomargarita sp. SDUM461003]|uniref:Winged helix-turn-helix domain-containing protein n=1 Tax=Thalassobacterium maritimum TaxID=3041265 RepID=A0ABU1AXH8_9BACT|nr:winged helix-turn-helix domain-containing protein [Coraliomargarita sp. SDUM461003]MDQ8208861.1 winged helix-turn-helix domain-containing protein [Coraliomargarita sp. SDUM461003]|tara:strand:- start:2957 stop:3319 length:363 start_codon:yes stop_codon:yes gene_type:complete